MEHEVTILVFDRILHLNLIFRIFYLLMFFDDSSSFAAYIKATYTNNVIFTSSANVKTTVICNQTIMETLRDHLGSNSFNSIFKHKTYTIMCITYDSVYWITPNSKFDLSSLCHENLFIKSIGFDKGGIGINLQPHVEYNTHLGLHYFGELKYFAAAESKDIFFSFKLGNTHMEGCIESELFSRTKGAINMRMIYDNISKQHVGFSLKSILTIEPNDVSTIKIGPEFILKPDNIMVDNTFYSNYCAVFHTDVQWNGLGLGVIWNGLEVAGLKLYFEFVSWLTIGYSHSGKDFDDGVLYISINL